MYGGESRTQGRREQHRVAPPRSTPKSPPAGQTSTALSLQAWF